MSRHTEIVINLPAICANVRRARQAAPDSKILAVVKADAYGHGLAPVARAISSLVDAYAVATIDEAEQLRNAGLQQTIMLLEGVFEEQEWRSCAEHNFCPVLHSEHQLQQLKQQHLPTALAVWLKVDTGMHRLGIEPARLDDCLNLLESCMVDRDALTLLSHFACAEYADHTLTRSQLEEFSDLQQGCKLPASLANSAAILDIPAAHYDWVRPGIMLYGASPSEQRSAKHYGLQSAMQFRSEVIAIRDVGQGESVGYGASWTAAKASRIATIAVGYGDGYPRHAPSGTPVLIHGQMAKLCGRVSMDMITADVSELKNVAIGSEVELWGEQLSVDTVAMHCQTIGYELLTRMPVRTPRRYVY